MKITYPHLPSHHIFFREMNYSFQTTSYWEDVMWQLEIHLFALCYVWLRYIFEASYSILMTSSTKNQLFTNQHLRNGVSHCQATIWTYYKLTKTCVLGHAHKEYDLHNVIKMNCRLLQNILFLEFARFSEKPLIFGIWNVLFSGGNVITEMCHSKDGRRDRTKD